MRILIADDHSLVRQGLRLLLELQDDFDVVAEADNGQQAWKLARELRPDMILMDVFMPELSGAQATERIRISCPTAKILAISAYQDEAHVRQILTAGASGYILKKAASQELVKAIRMIMAGGVYLDPAITGQVTGGYVDPITSQVGKGGLSPREIEVLVQVALGHTNKEIARKLHLSVKTIEGHKFNLSHKLGLGSRAEIVRYALRRGWLSDT